MTARSRSLSVVLRVKRLAYTTRSDRAGPELRDRSPGQTAHEPLRQQKPRICARPDDCQVSAACCCVQRPRSRIRRPSFRRPAAALCSDHVDERDLSHPTPSSVSWPASERPVRNRSGRRLVRFDQRLEGQSCHTRRATTGSASMALRPGRSRHLICASVTAISSFGQRVNSACRAHLPSTRAS
jgi:hypothetical protein